MNRVTTIQQLAETICEAADRAGRSEARLQGLVDNLLEQVLEQYGIHYEPDVNLGLARTSASSNRPDSLFGHVVLDYKAPNTLRTRSILLRAKEQLVDDYLKPICARGDEIDAEEASKWVGILLDGHQILFATFNGVDTWECTPPRPVNVYTVLSLVQYYRALYRKPLDPHLLSRDFGRDTDVGENCIVVLASRLANPTMRTTMLFTEWRRMFEQVSTYELDQLPTLVEWAAALDLPGREDPSHVLYCLHTYYALVVKLLTAELLSVTQLDHESFWEKLAHTDEGEPFKREIALLEAGETYEDLRILNFPESNFFAWYLGEWDEALEQAVREMIEVFRGYEPATPKLAPQRCQDLLKVFYSEVVDQQLRHDLGEYYTPDWLADLTLNRAGYNGQLDARLLDPACGSGTFLVLALRRLIEQAKAARLSTVETVHRATSQIMGFDLNPLAIISARANYLFALSEYLPEYGGDIEIPVYLADCINIPTEQTVQDVNCFVYTLDTELGPRRVALPSSLVQAHLMAPLLRKAEEAVTQRESPQQFIETVTRDSELSPYIGSAEERVLRSFYETIIDLEVRDWDAIWCRIVKNHFSSQAIPPVQYVVGNPPWVRWSRLPRRYRERCKQFCNYYGLVSGRQYTGGIESDISTVVTYSAADNWLADNGVLAFLITASVFKTDSAAGFRRFELPGGAPLYPLSIDDLVSLKPFPDAQNETSLIVLRKGVPEEDADDSYPAEGVPYCVWSYPKSGQPIDFMSTLSEVRTLTVRTPWRATPIAQRGSPLFTGSAEDIQTIRAFQGSSEYEELAHKGTTTDKARVYWVNLVTYDEANQRARIRTLTEDELARARADITGTRGFWIEGELLYPLIRGRDVGRFCFQTEDWHIIAPNQHYNVMDNEQTFRTRYPLAYRYFRRNRETLAQRSTYRRYLRGKPFYAIYDVGEYTFRPHKVVWLEQQDPRAFRAAVIGPYEDSRVEHTTVVPDHKLYMVASDSAEETHYICAVLNSTHIRCILGGFLAGKQIGTNIFRYVGIPVYDGTSAVHRALAQISMQAHKARRGTHTKADLPRSQQDALDRLVYQLFDT